MKRTKIDTLDRELRTIDPVRVEELHPHCDSTAERLLEAIISSESTQADGRSSRRHPRFGRKLPSKRVLAAAAAVGIAVLAAVAIGLPNDVGGNHTARAELQKAADAAASQPVESAQSPYLFLKTKFTSVDTSVGHGKTWSTYHSEVREEWVAADGSGRRRAVEQPARFVGRADREGWEAAGKPQVLPDGVEVTEDSLPPGGFGEGVGSEDPSRLPTDPSALAKRLQQDAEAAGGNVPVAARTLDLIGEVLRNPAAEPELRAALYEAAALVPGVEYLGQMTDIVGRHGVAVGLTSSYSGGRTLYALIYDPNNSKALASEEIAQEQPSFADTEAPYVISATIFLSSERVDSLSKY